jgi:molecular chaperone GrpE (heat shock protein)
MADEPTNGELSRLIGQLDTRFHSRFAELNSRLDKVVSLDVYTIQTTYVEQRLASLQSDIQRCADANAKLEDDFEQYQRDVTRQREDERQKRLYQAILPVLLGLLSVAVAVWAVVSR